MAEKTNPIKIESASLDEYNGTVILRGVIALESLPDLLVDDYQREELSPAQRSSIMEGLKKGEPLPDFELGMRGERCREYETGKVRLYDPVYIIDGQQRKHTIAEFRSGNPEAQVRVGVKVFFNTTKEWERERFKILNADRIKVAPSILLRNLRETNPSVQTLWGLTRNERTFVMYDRVCWSQNMARGELITALMFAQIASMLHAHKSGIAKASAETTAGALDRVSDTIGVQNMRENLRLFWGLIDECWGIQRVHHRGGAPHLKGNFLFVLAKLLSDHYDFWQGEDEKKLFVHAPLRRKLAQFDVNDLEVTRLAGSGGKARDILYILLRDHINSGKRTKRLSSRNGDAIILANQEEEGDEAPKAA